MARRTRRKARRNPTRRRRNPIKMKNPSRRRRRNPVRRRRNTGMKLDIGSLLIGGAIAYLFHDKIAQLLGQASKKSAAAGWGALHLNPSRRRNPLMINGAHMRMNPGHLHMNPGHLKMNRRR